MKLLEEVRGVTEKDLSGVLPSMISTLTGQGTFSVSGKGGSESPNGS